MRARLRDWNNCAEFEGLWCFGHHNKALFLTFQNLTKLCVKVQSDEFVKSSKVGM